MSSTFELDAEIASLTIGRYAGRAEDKAGSRRRYNITNVYGRVAGDLTRADLAMLAQWIVAELAELHEEE